MEIEKVAELADAVIVCLSINSVTKEGYVQKELRKVLDLANEKPEGTIFIIPLRLNECDIPRRLRGLQYANYFPDFASGNAFDLLIASLKARAKTLEVNTKMLILTPLLSKDPMLAKKLAMKRRKRRRL